MFKEFSLGDIVLGSSLIQKKRETSQNDHSLSLVVIHCYSFSFVVICCHTLSFVVIRCHSLSLVVPLVVTRCTTRCNSLSFVVTRCTIRFQLLSLLVVTQCITLLSFYKRSNQKMKFVQLIEYNVRNIFPQKSCRI